MIHILVVDDEPISADGISIYLQEHGRRDWVVRTAYNGMQALEIARQRVDILVSDIVMPGMDGFQVKEKVHSMWPMSKCIFLTSVQQIDFMQRAIRSGNTTDYVLKTESTKKILSAVQKAVADQEEMIHTQDILKKAQQDMIKVRPMLQKELMQSVILGSRRVITVVQQFRELGLELWLGKPVLLILGHIGDGEMAGGMPDMSAYVLNNIMEKYFWPTYRTYVVSVSDHRIAILLQNAVLPEEQDVRYVFYMMETVQQTFQKAGGIVSFAVDDEYCSWEELSAHYHVLSAVLERNLCVEEALVLRGELDSLPEDSPTEELYKAHILLENGNYEEAASIIQGINVPCTIRGRINLYRKFLKLLIAAIDSQEQVEHIYEEIRIPRLSKDEIGWRNMQLEISAIFCRFAVTENVSSKRMEQTIEAVCRYVKENLAEDLSLVRLADMEDISPTYLSRMFKEVKGIGYNDFVVASRMERAAYLIHETNLKLADIAGQVGYESSSYFIRTFRRTFDVTPTEYRNRLKGK